MHIKPKNVCNGALALDPNKIVVITEGPSGHIDVFSSDPGALDMLKAAKRHINKLSG